VKSLFRQLKTQKEPLEDIQKGDKDFREKETQRLKK